MDVKRLFVLGMFAASALQAAPQLQLSTAAIGPLNISGGANGATQTVQATNIGDGALSLSVSSTATWLVPTVAANSNVQIALNTASLPAGSYTEFVTVNSPGAVDAPQTISVTIQVGGVPNSVELYAAPNGGIASTQFQAQSRLTTSTKTADGANWLAVSLNGQGSFNFFYPYLIQVTTQPSQAAGDYSGSATFSGGTNAADNKTVNVTLHVTSQPIAQFGTTSVLMYGVAGGAQVTQSVAVTNSGQGTLSITGGTASSGATWLSASAGSNGSVNITGDPSGLQAGVYRGSITLNSNAANSQTNSLPVEFVVSTASAPVISFGGVVDNTTGKPILAPGDIASVYGSQLSGASPAAASSLPLSTSLGGAQVLVNGIPAPLYYASNGQVNFQVPFATAPGPAKISMIYNGQQGNTVTTTVNMLAPRILRLSTANTYAIIVNQDGSFPMPPTPGYNSHAAKAGDVLTIYAIGLGATTPAVADGVGAPAAEPLARTHVPNVYFGGGFASTPTAGQVLYSGLTPGFVGLYQINVQVPSDAPIGDAIGLILTLDGAVSNNVVVAIGR